jgi:hypothetical protein
MIVFEWVESESEHNWSKLISHIKCPKIAIVDGNPGLLASVNRHWKDARIQRCSFHMFSFIRQKLSLNPKTDAGKELLCLSKMMFHITKLDRALDWINEVIKWGKRWSSFLNEKTISQTSFTPTGRPRKWYTHKKLRAAHKHILNAIINDQIFTYLFEDIPNTTNKMEGGVNARLKELRRCHRGISLDHEKRLFEWYLWSRSECSKLPKIDQKSTQNAT